MDEEEEKKQERIISKPNIFSIIIIIFLISSSIAYCIFPMDFEIQHESIEGFVTDIDSYVDGGFLISSSTHWIIEIDNTTVIEASNYLEPYKLDIGDYVNITFLLGSKRPQSIEIIEYGDN